MECEGKGYTWSGYFPSVKECAASCQGDAKMFSHDIRPDCGSNCDCYCWNDSEDGTCKEGQKEHKNFNLYRFKQGNLQKRFNNFQCCFCFNVLYLFYFYKIQ